MNAIIKQRIEKIRHRENLTGYRRTRLGVIPAAWCLHPLSVVLTENKTRNRKGEYTRNDVLSVSGDCGVTNQIELLGRSFAGVSVADYHEVKYGDVVYTKSPLKANPYGIIKQNKKRAGIVSTLYAVYTPIDYETGTYIDYYFSNDSSVNNYLRPLVRKGTKNDMKINNEDALRGEIILPPQNERQKIVEILECCDEVIRLKKELIAEKKKQKNALMQKLLDPDSGFRLPGFWGRWERYRLGDLGNTYTGLSGKKGEDFGNGFNYIPYLNIFSNPIVKIDFMDKVLIEKNEKQNTVKYGDVFFTTSSETPEEVGMSSVLLSESPNTYLNSFCFGFRLNDFNILLPHFAAYYFRGTHIRTLLNNLAQGATRHNLSKNNFLNSELIIPPTIQEQRAIADILSAADKEIDLLEQELVQQEKKKKSLMQLLLTGIVEVSA